MPTQSTSESRIYTLMEVATARVLAEDRIIDQVTLDDVFLAWVAGRDLQKITRALPLRKIPKFAPPAQPGSAVKFLNGGVRIEENIRNNVSANAGFIEVDEPITTSQIDPVTKILFDWKTYYTSVSYNTVKAARNAGEQQIYSYIDEIIEATRINAAQAFGVALTSANGAASKEITGLQVLVPTDPTTGTIGGINRATHTYFRSQVQNGNSKPFSLSTLTTLLNDCTKGPRRPNACFTTQAIYEAMLSDFRSRQRYPMTEPNDMKRLGFPSFDVEDGVAITYSDNVPTGYLWALNRADKGVRLYINQNQLLGDFTTWVTNREQQQIKTSTQYMDCELFVPEPRLCGLYYGIAT